MEKLSFTAQEKDRLLKGIEDLISKTENFKQILIYFFGKRCGAQDRLLKVLRKAQKRLMEENEEPQ